MPRRVAVQSLNASTIDIMNVIRQNASYDYQQNVPEVIQATDIPKVGEVIYGTPAFANQFVNALVNRIALVRADSATFNNPYARLKKGYLEFGESVEEIFVNIAKVVDYTPEKGAEREFKRTLPDVSSAFHVMNWRVMYPITIQDEDLRMAFLSAEGVTQLITKIIDSVYTAAEYDEFLLFKYLIIKGVTHGAVKAVGVPMQADNVTPDYKAFVKATRRDSELLRFMKKDYNAYGVRTNTPKERMAIFISADVNASMDVDVLASAFNMDKTDFLSKREIIDDFSTFDNERFEVIRANSDGVEEVTEAELQMMQNALGFLVDENWFQVYDNLTRMTEKYVASGLYWNYFYHTWKTISWSPFSNAILYGATAFGTIANFAPTGGKVVSADTADGASAVAVEVTVPDGTENANFRFVQTQLLTTAGIAVHPYGGLLIPKGVLDASNVILQLYNVNDPTKLYETQSILVGDLKKVGTTFTIQEA